MSVVAKRYWFDRPPMEPVAKLGSTRAYGHTIGPAQRALERWVGGASLTPGLQHELGDFGYTGHLIVEGVYVDGHMRWSARFGQHGHPDRHGLVGGAGSAEDACDRAVELILEDEAERALFVLVPGLA